MGNQPAVQFNETGERKWGAANPRRGPHQEVAAQFVAAYPVGSQLSADEFDQWAQGAGHLKVPVSVRRNSDAWKAHLQRRHELKYRINQAGTHPRMPTPFIIEALGSGVWEVRSPHQAISKTKMFASLESLMSTKRKQLEYLMQSSDWNVLPPHERAFAEALFDDIEMFQSSISLSVDQLSRKFSKLEGRLRRAVQLGEIRPGGGVRAITAEPDSAVADVE